MARISFSRSAARRGPSPREQRRERERTLRREDILAAASRVFAEKGFHDTQVSEVAALAEVSLASVYQLFESKEELFETVTVTAAEAIGAVIRERVEGIAEPAARLLGVAEAMFACFHQNQDLLRIYARATHGLPWRARGELGDRTQEIFHRFADWVVALAREAEGAGALRGLDPETFATSLIGAVVTSATRAVESDDAAALARVAPRVRALFAKALAGDTS